MLDRTATTKLVEDLVASYTAYEEIHSTATALFGSIVETPLADKIAASLDRHITAVEYAIGDLGHTWVYWYVWETSCGGRKDLNAFVDSVEYPVGTVEDFVNLLVALGYAHD